MSQHPVLDKASQFIDTVAKNVRQTSEVRDAAAVHFRTQRLVLSGESVTHPGAWFYTDGGAGNYEGEVGHIGSYEPLRLSGYLRESAERDPRALIFEVVITFDKDRSKPPAFVIKTAEFDPTDPSGDRRLEILTDFRQKFAKFWRPQE